MDPILGPAAKPSILPEDMLSGGVLRDARRLMMSAIANTAFRESIFDQVRQTIIPDGWSGNMMILYFQADIFAFRLDRSVHRPQFVWLLPPHETIHERRASVERRMVLSNALFEIAFAYQNRRPAPVMVRGQSVPDYVIFPEESEVPA